jgi:DNA-directed RNA polymerase subunit K/omega
MSELKEINDEDLFDKEDANDKEEEPVDEEYSDKEEEAESDADDAESDNLESDVEYDSEMEGEEGGGMNKMQKTGGAKKSGAGADASGADASGADASGADTSDADASDTDNGSDDDDDDDDYLQKFNQSMRDDLILNFHPESKSHNYEEIKQLAKVTRNKNGIVVDELHKTIPLLTKYEKTRILGQRAKQIESGATPLVQVPPNIIDSYLIAKLELAQNTIPFIIRRPLPNGGMEYWHVSDLENV